jgi:hypothetical protein
VSSGLGQPNTIHIENERLLFLSDINSESSLSSSLSLQKQRKLQEQNNPLSTMGPGSTGFAGNGTFDLVVSVSRYYTANGFLCDADNKALISEQHPFGKGGTVRVCVKPSLVALGDKVRIRSIDSFEWMRDNGNVTQTSISANAKAEPDTQLVCEAGLVTCAFETKLADSFFVTDGKVEGKGSVWLQLDNQNPTRVEFNLEYSTVDGDTNGKKSSSGIMINQMDPGFAGASPFGVYLYVVQEASTRGENDIYQCRAYACEEQTLQEYVSTEVLEQNSSQRVCVAPTEPAQAAGVRMWSIEWWDWTRQNFTQSAIVAQGLEAPDGRTIQRCDRGSTICEFQTRLRNEFFNTTGILEGTGQCWLTFGGMEPFQARIVTETSSETDDTDEEDKELIDPTTDPLYAGGGEVGLILQVTGNYIAVPELCPAENHELKLWWEDLPGGTRFIYTMIMVGTGSSMCCLLVCCFICGYRRDEKTEQRGGGNIEVNLNMEDIQKKSNHYHQHDEVHRESNLALLDGGPSLPVPYANDAPPAGGSNREIENGRNQQRRGSGRELVATNGGGQRSITPKMRDADVYFGLDSHPGTRNFQKMVRKCIQEGGSDASFDPTVYKTLQKRMGEECRFFSREGSGTDWRETTSKQELIRLFGNCWRNEKYK